MTAERYRYRAFISYSHRDASVAQWLHSALESYRAPKHLIGRETPTGTIQKRLGPLFRDRDELPVAADLTGQINEALAATQFLIVLCSTASAKSKWVNQEVINFKRLKGAGSIIAVIVDGEPFASNMPGREAEECFAPALRFHVTADGALSDQPAEPIAADLRTGKDGKRLVKLKVLAGLLGVGLDELVQRETLRRQRFMTAVTFASLAGIGVMGALTFDAIEARNEAEVAQGNAERRRSEAESLIEYMVTDLRDPLRENGRVKEFNEISERTLKYYNNEVLSALPDNSVAQRARVLQFVGESRLQEKDYAGAEQFLTAARDATMTLSSRHPNDTERLNEHSQSEFLLGRLFLEQNEYVQAERAMASYVELAARALSTSPENLSLQAFVAKALVSHGGVLLRMGDIKSAKLSFLEADARWSAIQKSLPNDDQVLSGVAVANAWAADALRMDGEIIEAISSQKKNREAFEKLRSTGLKDRSSDLRLATSYRKLARLYFESGQASEALAANNSAITISSELIFHDSKNGVWLEEYIVSTVDSALLDWNINNGGGAKRIAQSPSLDAAIAALPVQRGFPRSEQAKTVLSLLNAQFLNKIGDYTAAEKILVATLDRMNKINSTTSSSESRFYLAETLLALGDTKQKIHSDLAKTYWEQSFSILNDPHRTTDPVEDILIQEAACRLQIEKSSDQVLGHISRKPRISRALISLESALVRCAPKSAKDDIGTAQTRLTSGGD